MDYFEKFSNVLDNNFHGDFNSLMDSKTKFDRYQGIPLRIKEIDRRKPVEPVYVVPEEPIVPEVIPDDIHFEVIDLDIEMEKRKQNTDAAKDVKVDTSVPAPAEKFSITLKRRVTKKSPRGRLYKPKRVRVFKSKPSSTVTVPKEKPPPQYSEKLTSTETRVMGVTVIKTTVIHKKKIHRKEST